MVFDIFNIYTLVEALFLILPAYATNGLVPVFKGTHPVDFNRKLGKHRIFGPGKTWEGLIFGSIVGVIIGAIEMFANPYIPWELSPVPLNIVPMTPALGFTLGLGTILGDMGGSFIKRRLGLQGGQAAPVLDQDDFVVGALLVASVIIAVDTKWAILLLVMTPLIHWLACIIGYLLKLKKTPW